MYWHSEEYKDKKYHAEKQKFLEGIGISTMMIWEDDWTHKKEIVQSIIINKLGKSSKIYARKCSIEEEINVKFFEENHIDSYTRGAKYQISLVYEGEVVCSMSFGKPRWTKHHFEIYRFATKKGFNVIGGFSKLLNYFIKTKNPKSILSYRKKDFGISSFYENFGFTLTGKTDPNYYWIVDGIRFNRQNFMKSKLPESAKNMTESDYMRSIGSRKIWDCGSDVYVMEFI